MFQNINENTVNTARYEEDNSHKKKIEIFSNVLSIKNIIIYVITFMISMVGVTGEFSPFSISILGACLANSVPALGVVLAGIIGSAIKFGVSGAVGYILTVLTLIATMFIIKVKQNDEEKNEQIKLSKNIFIATLIIQILKLGINGFTLYDALASVSFSIIAVVFYKIFVNSLSVIQDFRENKAFSIEEVLGASLLLSISVSAFNGINIFGFSVQNILSILIVLILGWKNGVLVGTTAGVTIGVTLGVITSSDPIMVAAYAISGMIAGILNRFGKIGVIVGFCLGNVVLAYVSNGYTVELIHFKEILIASIGLLAVPKSIRINIEEFTGGSKLLPVFPDRALNKSKETAERLNNVSETIQEMAKTYKIDDAEELKQEENINNKEIFINELLDNLNGYENNMLYEDISNTEGKIIDEIFELLLDKQEINREQLLEIFARCNSYIIGFDDKNISEYLEENIAQMVRVINMSYKISKEQFIKEKRQIIELLKLKDINIQEISIQKEDRFLIEIYMEKSNNVDIDEIKKILTEVLGEEIAFNQDASIGTRLNFLSDDKFVMAIGMSEKTKENSQTSGDSTLTIRLKDGKYLVALSDGMGSGEKAKQSSQKALKMLENLFLSGFDKNTSMELINSSLISQNEEIFATLDIAIVDLYNGCVEFIKGGACPTYIKNSNKVQIIKSNSLPAGIINHESLQLFDKDIEAGDIMVMCSDGILDSNIEYKNKELWVKYLLEDIETNNTKKIADLILNEAIDNNFGTAKDDMSVIACKFVEK